MTYSFVELLIFFDNSRYLVFEDNSSPHHRNIVSEYKLHGKPIMK